MKKGIQFQYTLLVEYLGREYGNNNYHNDTDNNSSNNKHATEINTMEAFS